MDKEENSLNDYQEQYDILVEEEQEKQRKKSFWILFFCLIILLFSVLGATYSYYRVFSNTEKSDLNIDTDGDGKPDLNVDLNSDNICDINCDLNGDGKPDLNIDYRGDLKAHFNLDTNGDGKPDFNLINQSNNNGIACNKEEKCDLNCDTSEPKDNHPNINIDMDGDGRPDINIDIDCDGVSDINIDTDGDGRPDLNIDTNGDKICDLNCDTNGDGKPDKNIDSDGDGICDDNCDNKNDEKPKPKPPIKDPIIEVKPSEDDENAILYVNYTKGVEIEGMLPDTSESQTFTVENQSNRTLFFTLNFENVVNDFTVPEGFTYQVIQDNINKTEEIKAPTKDGMVLENIIMIPAHTTYNYEIVYTFHNLPDVNQTADQNKTFSAKIIAKIVER